MAPELKKLCIHTITTKSWEIEQSSEAFAEAGVGGITVWRQALEGRNIARVGDRLRQLDLTVVSLCRGGFFPSTSSRKRQANIDDNLQALDEAAALGAPMIVLVCGADPDQPLSTSRDQIRAGIEAVLPRAEELNIKLAIEPLHPMYADTRSAINTLSHANDMAETIDSPYVGVAVDVYHLWWDPSLEHEIARCGEHGNLLAYHICDWKYPVEDILNDRGLMGEGCIDLPQIRSWVESAGFTGFHEVEIFSNRYWAMDQQEFLSNIIDAYTHYS